MPARPGDERVVGNRSLDTALRGLTFFDMKNVCMVRVRRNIKQGVLRGWTLWVDGQPTGTWYADKDIHAAYEAKRAELHG